MEGLFSVRSVAGGGTLSVKVVMLRTDGPLAED